MTAISDLRLNGTGVSAQLADALRSIEIAETFEVASALTLTLYDPNRAILASGLVAAGTVVHVGGRGWELVKVAKQSRMTVLTCEDAAVAAWRRDVSSVKAPPGSVSRVDFVRQLGAAIPSVPVVAPVQGPAALVELAAGEDNGSGPEDHWAATRRIMDEIGWRVFIRDGAVFVAPDEWILRQPPVAVLREHTDGIDEIDFDVDVGKPVATLSVPVRSSPALFRPGDRTDVAGLGPADGPWIVSARRSSPLSEGVTLELVRSRPTLPEPKPDTAIADKALSTDTPANPTNADMGEPGYTREITGKGPAGTGGSADVRTMLAYATAQAGKPYVWGAKGPDAFDCSGLIEQATAKVSRRMPSGSKNQFAQCRSANTLIPVDQAIRTRGALLMRMTGNPTHIGFSLGDGRTMEAMGRAYGVLIGKATGRGWTHGGLVPGLQY